MKYNLVRIRNIADFLVKELLFFYFFISYSDIDVHAQFAVNQSRPEEITMREDLGNITLIGDDGFGNKRFFECTL